MMNNLRVSRKNVRCWIQCLFLVSAWTFSVAGTDIALRATEPGVAARKPGTITSGIPFAKGALTDVSALTLTANGRPVPAQFVRTVAWDDGSVRWALMDTQLEIAKGETTALTLSASGGNPAPAMAAKAEQDGDTVRLSSGRLTMVVGGKGGLIRSLKVDGKERLTGSSRGLTIMSAEGETVVAAAPDTVRIEQSGPLRATVMLSGEFPELHNGLLRYTARLTVFAGQPFVKAHAWLENHGAIGHGSDEKRPIEWFAFQGMAVDLDVALGDAVVARCEGVESGAPFKVLQVCRKGKEMPYFTWDDFAYVVSSGERPLKEGNRTDGVVELKGGDATLTVAIRDFWQNYEKAIELDGRALRLWLWPPEGQWPRTVSRHRQLRRYRNIAEEGRYLLQGSVHKGHEFILDFSGRPPEETAAELSDPLFALADAEHYAATGALPVLFAPPDVKTGNRNADFSLAAWTRMGRSVADPASPHGIPAARRDSRRFNMTYFGDQTQWYGWMDFGDLSVPGRGQVSLHYDWPLIALLDYVRHGDAASLRLGTEMIRHRVDIAQYWSDRDPGIAGRLQRGGNLWPYFRFNPQFGSVRMENNWVSGPVLWHMLTGEPKARDAVLRNVEGLKAAWKKNPGRRTQTDMAANLWAIEAFCAAYDLTADRTWLDEALALFDKNIQPQWQAQGPHLYAPVTYLHEGRRAADMDYLYGIAALCNLHIRTGNTRLLELLVAGCETEPRAEFYEAPLYLAGLFAYVSLAADKPDYLKEAFRLFERGFPDSRNPPVFRVGTPDWSERSAMRLRAGHLVQYAAWRSRRP